MPFAIFQTESEFLSLIMEIERTNERSSVKRIWFLLFSLIVFVGIFSYLCSTVSFQDVMTIIRGVTLRWMLLFLLLSFAMSLFRTWRYMIVLNVSGHKPDPVALYLITMVRNFFSDLLPARLGSLIYIYLVRSRLGVRFGAAASSFAFAFIFDMLALAFLLVLAVLLESANLVSPVAVIGSGIFIAAVSMVVLLLLPVILEKAGKICRSFPLVAEKYRVKLYTVLSDTRRDIVIAKEEGIYWRIFALSIGVRCFKYLSLYVLLLALVLPLGFETQAFPFPRVFLGLSSAELAASLPISGIAGFGAYEGAWALVFQLLGYSERIAALTSISHHLLTQVYGYSLGGFALLILLLPLFRKTARSPETVRSPALVFWPKFIASGAILLTIAFLLVPENGVPKSGQGKEVIGVGAVDLSNLKGKIVFQRPGGIYVMDISERKMKQVVSYGTYPRWSPDGKRIAFVHNNAILVMNVTVGVPETVARAGKARAVCFTPDGRALLFTDTNRVKKVDLQSRQVTSLLEDREFREIDMAENGSRLTATLRTPFGFKVKVFDLVTGEKRTVSNGCSASLSPDGELVTVNGKKHKRLYLYDWKTLQVKGFVSSPQNLQFDNQYWSNNAQWVVSTSEGSFHDIYVHHVRSDRAFRLTSTGDCDRADLFVSAFHR